MYFRKNESHRNYCNCSLQTRSLGSWISAYLSQVYSIFDFPPGPLLAVHVHNLAMFHTAVLCCADLQTTNTNIPSLVPKPNFSRVALPNLRKIWSGNETKKIPGV